MLKYISNNIISGNSDPRLKDAIGKKVYAGDSPVCVLNNAENDEREYTLIQVIEGDYPPFFVLEDKYGNRHESMLIILKKEDTDPGYVPFEDLHEFVLACHDHTGFMKPYGLWILCSLPHSGETILALVTCVYDDGVILGGGEEIVRWEELLETYSFEDGTPCGRLMEENNG